MNNFKLKRLFKKILFFLIITIILWFIKLSMVSAATYDPSYFKVMGNETIRNNFYAKGGKTIITVNSVPLSVVPIESQNYIELTYCITQPLVSTWTISNDSLDGAIVPGNFNYIKFNNIDCALDNYPGKVYRFYLQVYKWGVPSGGSDVYQVSSYLNISDQGFFSIYNLLDIKISDSDNYYNDLIQFNNGVDQTTIINQNGQIIDNTNSTNQKLDDLNKNLTDETSPNLNGLENSAGWLKPGPVDSIVNLPLNLLNNLQTNLGNTCNPVTVKLPYVNKDINLPCISAIYKQINGLDTWFQGIGVIAAAFILYKYFMYLYNRIDDTLSFRENNMQGYFDDSLWGGM